MELSAMGAAPQPTRREQRAQPGSSLGHSAEQRQAAAGELLLPVSCCVASGRVSKIAFVIYKPELE